MPAYMIFIRESEVRDEDALARYRETSRSGGGQSAHLIKPLVVYGETETVEGEPADGFVVMEFPDREAARAWYNSPEYQKAVPHRMQAADYRAFIVDGWTPPGQGGV